MKPKVIYIRTMTISFVPANFASKIDY